METRRIQITDTILRDAHQSLIATRMRIDDMLPVLEQLDEVGYFSLEMWGGATFDVCMRFLNEDPWERLRTIRAHVKKTRLQMLLRGQNLVGYRHYADDLVDAFVEEAHGNGIDVFRIFDALNDIRNLSRAMHAANRVGAVVEGTISYTISPVHTIAGFVRFAQELKNEGAHIICVKDMAGMISPSQAFELISALKSDVGLPVHLHTHCSSGMAPATIYAAAQAGMDIVDCALSPFSWGTSQPPTESIVGVFGGTPFDTGLDQKQLARIADHFEQVRERYMPILDARSERVDTRILQHQTPGGMLSNLLSQLKAQKKEDRFHDVMLETARVREDLGFPPLVTPTSQIVGTQAVFNVLTGERYKTVTKEVQNYLKGLYGRAPAPMNAELQRKVLGDAEPVTCRPADLIPAEMEQHLAVVREKWGGGREEALSLALFPQVAPEFFDARRAGRQPSGTDALPETLARSVPKVDVQPAADARELNLDMAGRASRVQVEKTGKTGEYRIFIDGAPHEVRIHAPARARARHTQRKLDLGGTIKAEMPGILLEYKVKAGDEVAEGQVVAVFEAMKMQNELRSPKAGQVKALVAPTGRSLEVGATILEIA